MESLKCSIVSDKPIGNCWVHCQSIVGRFIGRTLHSKQLVRGAGWSLSGRLEQSRKPMVFYRQWFKGLLTLTVQVLKGPSLFSCIKQCSYVSYPVIYLFPVFWVFVGFFFNAVCPGTAEGLKYDPPIEN